MNSDRTQATGPVCPFCGSAWTAAMLAELDRYTVASSCACCGGDPHAGAGEASEGPAAMPTEDLCCENCGKPIYRAPV